MTDAALKPGIYEGKDGERYKVMSDGTTYRMKYVYKQRPHPKTGEMVQVAFGPTLVRVGRTQLKNASPSVAGAAPAPAKTEAAKPAGGAA